MPVGSAPWPFSHSHLGSPEGFLVELRNCGRGGVRGGHPPSRFPSFWSFRSFWGIAHTSTGFPLPPSSQLLEKAGTRGKAQPGVAIQPEKPHHLLQQPGAGKSLGASSSRHTVLEENLARFPPAGDSQNLI